MLALFDALVELVTIMARVRAVSRLTSSHKWLAELAPQLIIDRAESSGRGGRLGWYVALALWTLDSILVNKFFAEWARPSVFIGCHQYQQYPKRAEEYSEKKSETFLPFLSADGRRDDGHHDPKED